MAIPDTLWVNCSCLEDNCSTFDSMPAKTKLNILELNKTQHEC